MKPFKSECNATHKGLKAIKYLRLVRVMKIWKVNKLMDSSGKWTAALPANKLLVFVMFMIQVNTHS